VQYAGDGAVPNDCRLRTGSPAVAVGIVLPPELENPVRPAAGVRPDIGAFPLGADSLRIGIHGRFVCGRDI